MKTFNLVTLVLTIVGALDLGSLGILHSDVLANIFGAGSLLNSVVDFVIGLSAIYQIYPFVRALRTDEVHAEVAHR